MTFILYLLSLMKRQVYLYEILSLALASLEVFIPVFRYYLLESVDSMGWFDWALVLFYLFNTGVAYCFKVVVVVVFLQFVCLATVSLKLRNMIDSGRNLGFKSMGKYLIV